MIRFALFPVAPTILQQAEQDMRPETSVETDV